MINLIQGKKKKHQLGNKLKTGIEILTMREDMICGVMSQKAFEQCSGNRQQASSFIEVTVDRTSYKKNKKTYHQAHYMLYA